MDSYKNKAQNHRSLLVYRDNINKTYNFLACPPDKNYVDQCSRLIKNDSNLKLVKNYNKIKTEIINNKLTDDVNEDLNNGWIDLQNLEDIISEKQ